MPKKTLCSSLSETNLTFKIREQCHCKKSTNSANKKTWPICNAQQNKEKKSKTFLSQWLENCLKLRALKPYNLHKLKKAINLKEIKPKNKKKAVAESGNRNLCSLLFVIYLFILSTFWLVDFKILFKKFLAFLQLKLQKQNIRNHLPWDHPYQDHQIPILPYLNPWFRSFAIHFIVSLIKHVPFPLQCIRTSDFSFIYLVDLKTEVIGPFLKKEDAIWFTKVVVIAEFFSAKIYELIQSFICSLCSIRWSLNAIWLIVKAINRWTGSDLNLCLTWYVVPEEIWSFSEVQQHVSETNFTMNCGWCLASFR